ncbi:MAG: hypothetical protein H2184_08830 [Candidatus Galacturonibacter soehngenii]|nr:hypothetical protein [Candidatus Galacturonibacter soehngenii]
MAKTKILRKHIKEILSELAETYYIDATENAKFPYICFEARRIDLEGNKGTYILEVNIWNKGTNTSEIDDLMDDVEKKLNYYKHIDSKLQLSIYNGALRQYVEDTDKTIKRIREQFELQVYERIG